MIEFALAHPVIGAVVLALVFVFLVICFRDDGWLDRAEARRRKRYEWEPKGDPRPRGDHWRPKG